MRARWLKVPLASGAYRRWLIDRGSLTRQLQRRCADFRVQPVRLCNTRLRTEEAGLLDISTRSRVLLREVRLHGGGEAAVFARSLLPYRSLRGRWQGLGALGNRPLGGELFADPSMVRTPIAYRKLAWHHELYRRAVDQLEAPPPALWARRSVFRLRGAAILVTEVFLPQVLAL